MIKAHPEGMNNWSPALNINKIQGEEDISLNFALTKLPACIWAEILSQPLQAPYPPFSPLRRLWSSKLMLSSSEIPQHILYSNLKRNMVVFIRRCAPNANGNKRCSLSPLSPQKGEQDAQRDGAWWAGACSSSGDSQPGLLDMMLGW